MICTGVSISQPTLTFRGVSCRASLLHRLGLVRALMSPVCASVPSSPARRDHTFLANRPPAYYGLVLFHGCGAEKILFGVRDQQETRLRLVAKPRE